MGNEQSSKPQATSTSGSWTDRPQAIYAAERARVLFGGYRASYAGDPDAYVEAVAAVLSAYEPKVIQRATDSEAGISSQEQFKRYPPNSGELKEFCEGMRQRDQSITHLREKLQKRGASFVLNSAPSYRAMRERATSDPGYSYLIEDEGIWVPKEWL